jgi:nitric oxide reductase subunit C
MNKKQTRLFAIASTAIASLVFIALTIDSHRQFPKLTNAENITPAVSHGMDVWHKYNCINCHTLFGEGAYYAPDLTKITQHRGEQYLQAYMRDPSQFYDEQRHRRLMPQQNLAPQEITDLIAFLDWVSKVDNQGWPPRPILVTGASIPGTDMSAAQQAQSREDAPIADHLPPGARPVSSGSDPMALGQSLFRSVTPACNACHSVAPGVNLAGPTLAGLATRAQQVVASPDYKGQAKDVAGYIRESIAEPSRHLIPGAMYSAGGTSFMPNTYGKDLKAEELDHLVAYLATFK